MPYTRISPTRNGRDAIDYALGGKDEKGHNKAEHRNLYITNVGLVPGNAASYAAQMNRYWRCASTKNKNQIRRIVISFSEQELDPQDLNSPLIAAEIAREFVLELYPDRQALICVQNDGEGGKIHSHILVSNVSMTDYKGCTDEQSSFHYVAQGADRIAKKFIDLEMDYSDRWDENGKFKLPKDRINQYVRKHRQENEKAIANGEPTPYYIWQDDLKERIRSAMEQATSEDDFRDILSNNGVTLERKGNSKRHGDYYTYVFNDTSGFNSEDDIPKRQMKVRSYSLGADFTPDALNKIIAEKKEANVEFASPFMPTFEEEPVKELSEEELKAQQEIEAEMREFDAWASEHGYSFIKGEYDIDLEKYERARKAYEEFKNNKSDAVTAIDEVKREAAISEPVIIPERSRVKVDKNSDIKDIIGTIRYDRHAESDKDKDKISDEPVEEAKESTESTSFNQMLMGSIQQDIEDIDCDDEKILKDIDDYFGI